MNPAAEGIDIAITTFPASFDNMTDEILRPMRRSLFASKQYLASYRRLNHPRQLEEHRCLVYQPTSPSWPFLSGNGAMTVTVHPRMSSNDMSGLLEAAKTHLGISF
jgi:DNA-binding transcriptional LysR family regulator